MGIKSKIYQKLKYCHRLPFKTQVWTEEIIFNKFYWWLILYGNCNNDFECFSFRCHMICGQHTEFNWTELRLKMHKIINFAHCVSPFNFSSISFYLSVFLSLIVLSSTSKKGPYQNYDDRQHFSTHKKSLFFNFMHVAMLLWKKGNSVLYSSLLNLFLSWPNKNWPKKVFYVLIISKIEQSEKGSKKSGIKIN